MYYYVSTRLQPQDFVRKCGHVCLRGQRAPQSFAQCFISKRFSYFEHLQGILLPFSIKPSVSKTNNRAKLKHITRKNVLRSTIQNATIREQFSNLAQPQPHKSVQERVKKFPKNSTMWNELLNGQTSEGLRFGTRSFSLFCFFFRGRIL